jgi:hypothetical protein
MDATAVELEGTGGQALLVPREDLERQGLATLGRPVALLRETLPGGGSYSLPLPAVALTEPSLEEADPPWETVYPGDGAMFARPLDDRDMRWLDRALAHEPTAIPAAPLPIA